MATERKVIELQINSSRAARQLGNINKNLNATRKSAQGLQRSFARLNRIGGLIFGGAILSRGIGNLIRLNDQYDELSGKVAVVARETVGLDRALDDLLEVSNRTLSSFEGAATFYARLGSATKNLGLEHKQLIDLIQITNDTLRLSGASAKESSAFITQFSQALGSGTLQGDEFRAVTESNVFLMTLLADSLDTTIGGLRNMSKEGKLTTDVLLNALLPAVEKVRKEAERLPTTVSREITRLGNNFQVLVDQVSDGIGVFEGIANAIGFVNDRFEELLELNRLASAEQAITEFTEVTRNLQRLRGELEAINAARAAGERVLEPVDQFGNRLEKQIQLLERRELILGRQLGLIPAGTRGGGAAATTSPEREDKLENLKALQRENVIPLFQRQLDDYASSLEELSQAEVLATEKTKILINTFESGTINAEQFREEFERLHPEVNLAAKEIDKNVNALAVAFGQTLASATNDAADALVDFAIRGEGSFKDFADSVLESVAKMLTQFALMRAMFGATGAGGVIGSFFPITQNAHGNAFSGGNVVPFAKGGIVNQPTLFPMAQGAGLMGEAGPEAVVPLTRTSSGDLGVKASGGTVVNINNYGSDNVDVSTEQTAAGLEIVNIAVGEVDRRIMTGGSTWQAISHASGARRAATTQR